MSNHVGAVAAQHPQRRTFSLLMTLLLIATFFSATVALHGGATRASAQTESSLAGVVPAESVLYMEADLDQSSDQWVQVYALLERAGLSDLAQQQLSITPEQAGQLAETFQFTGRAALAFTSPEAFTTQALGDFEGGATDATTNPAALAQSDVPEGFVVIFQPEDPQGLYEQFQGMVAGEAEEAGTTVETVDYNGTTIEFWTAVDDTTDPTAIALVGENVVLAVRPADIEPVVDTVNGEVEALSSNEAFTQVRDAFTTPSLSFGYANGAVIVDQAIAEDPASAQFLESSRAYVGWNAYADENGLRLDTVTVPGEGAMLPNVSAFDPTFAERISADTLFFLNGNDLANSGIFDLFGAALQASFSDMSVGIDATPVATPTVDDVYTQLESQLGFNLKTDLFDQLDGEFGVAVNADQILSDDPMVDVVFVSEVADETTVSDVASKISFILNSSLGTEATLEERQVTGGAVTSITIDDETTSGFPVVLEYGVINGELLIGVNGGIDNYLDGSTDTLADDAGFQQTMSVLPQENIVGVQYVNLARLLPMIEEAATAVSGTTSVMDNDAACGDYTTKEEAQEAYDADPVGLWNLDLDYDGMACEDFFGAVASPSASPVSVSENLNLVSIGTVSYTDGDLYRSSTILLVGE